MSRGVKSVAVRIPFAPSDVPLAYRDPLAICQLLVSFYSKDDAHATLARWVNGVFARHSTCCVLVVNPFVNDVEVRQTLQATVVGGVWGWKLYVCDESSAAANVVSVDAESAAVMILNPNITVAMLVECFQALDKPWWHLNRHTLHDTLAQIGMLADPVISYAATHCSFECFGTEGTIRRSFAALETPQSQI